jgi:hypothetical protein
MHFSDKQIFFYAFYKFGLYSKFSGNEICSQELFVPGQIDLEQLTRGARRATLEARLAWSAGALPSPTGSQAPAMAGRGRRYGARDRGEKGQDGPGAHQAHSGEVGWSEGVPAATNFGRR